jgi:hypothetical protein
MKTDFWYLVFKNEKQVFYYFEFVCICYYLWYQRTYVH